MVSAVTFVQLYKNRTMQCRYGINIQNIMFSQCKIFCKKTIKLTLMHEDTYWRNLAPKIMTRCLHCYYTSGHYQILYTYKILLKLCLFPLNYFNFYMFKSTTHYQASENAKSSYVLESSDSEQWICEDI